MDIQTLLVIILGILVVSLASVSFYIIVILKEFKITLHKVNSTLDKVQEIHEDLNEHIKRPINSFGTLIQYIPSILEAFKSVRAVRSLVDIDEKE